MARPRRHPLTTAVRKALPRPLPAAAAKYLELLDRRLQALAAITEGSPRGLASLSSLAGRAVARRFLSPLEGSWDDGDENLVRGYLDRWVPRNEDPLRAAARSLREAALALGGMEARPQTIWFFLWELESLLAEMEPAAHLAHGKRRSAGRGSGADKRRSPW